uniref:EOG090X083V n=1 Tax=Scapholeberis mucronata TaxID=202097 RepID=A0A4Y7NM70_9CRUS|nr:EOG090X083V [Scapholeberis mucronata]SVE93687.1 EOG090X083V [Scapholeberis mucronata]
MSLVTLKSGMANVKVINDRKEREKQDLNSLSKEELIERIHQLESHVVQLRNLLKSEPSIKEGNKKSKQFDHKRYARRHVLLQVAYLGWDYSGFVIQEHTEKTVEAELFKALEKTRLVESRETSNYHRCGRTDKGVSSFGQTISIDLRSNLKEGLGVYIPEGHQLNANSKKEENEIAYVSILNRVLPPEIKIIGWSPVSTTFSARFDCKQRTYHYYFPKANLNIEQMKTSAQFLIGEHDFRNFCKMDVGNGVVKFNRRIMDIQIDSMEEKINSYSMFRLKLVGQAFLWHQVRCIVSILFLVGQGKEQPTVVQDLLDVERNPRKPQYGMASEIPLNLFFCSYAEEDCQWIYDAESLRFVMSGFQSLWSENNIKATMLREILTELEKLSNCRIESQIKSLVNGIEPKTYVPLLKRQKCESLEERIEHYAKKKRIEIIDDETNFTS